MRTLLIIYFFITTSVSSVSFSQKLRKTLSHEKIALSKSLEKIKQGDTLVFTINKKKGSLYFKKNGKLKEHTFYAYCGNKYFFDYFIPKPPDFERVGKWNVLENNKTTTLSFNVDKKEYVFTHLYSEQNKINFIVKYIRDL